MRLRGRSTLCWLAGIFGKGVHSHSRPLHRWATWRPGGPTTQTFHCSGGDDIAANDEVSALSALEKANQAQTKAKDASEKVAKAKQELEEISAILSTVQEPG